jgi:hypothetical protein
MAWRRQLQVPWLCPHRSYLRSYPLASVCVAVSIVLLCVASQCETLCMSLTSLPAGCVQAFRHCPFFPPATGWGRAACMGMLMLMVVCLQYAVQPCQIPVCGAPCEQLCYGCYVCYVMYESSRTPVHDDSMQPHGMGTPHHLQLTMKRVLLRIVSMQPVVNSLSVRVVDFGSARA